MAAPQVLPDKEVERRLKEMPGWRRDGQDIVKELKFPEYLDGLEFVCQLGKVADDNDHHPDIQLGYKKVVVKYGTHSAGGITELDFMMAKKADEILKEFRVETGA